MTPHHSCAAQAHPQRGILRRWTAIVHVHDLNFAIGVGSASKAALCCVRCCSGHGTQSQEQRERENERSQESSLRREILHKPRVGVNGRIYQSTERHSKYKTNVFQRQLPTYVFSAHSGKDGSLNTSANRSGTRARERAQRGKSRSACDSMLKELVKTQERY